MVIVFLRKDVVLFLCFLVDGIRFIKIMWVLFFIQLINICMYLVYIYFMKKNFYNIWN